MSSHATISSNSNLHKVWLKNIRETFILFLPHLTISHELAFALPGIFCMVKYIYQWKGFVSLGNMQFFKILRDGDCHIAVFNSVKEDPSSLIIIQTEHKLFFNFFFFPPLDQFQNFF